MGKILEYLFQPLKEGYTLPKTFFYVFLLSISLYLIYLLIEKFKIKINKFFILSILPFLFFISALRVYQDLGIYDSLLLVTPWIEVLFFFTLFLSYSFALLLQKLLNLDHLKVFFLVGFFLFSLTFVNLPLKNPLPLFYVFIFLSPWILLTKPFFSNEDFMIIISHMLDANSSFVANHFFHLEEKHVVAIHLFALNPFLFIFLKFLLVVFVIFLVNKLQDKNLKNYIKLILLLLGLGPALRNCFLMVCYV